MRNNSQNVFNKINSDKYDLIFPMAYQILNNQNSLYAKLFKVEYNKYNNVNYSNCITGIHSAHSYDKFTSTPDLTISPPKKLLNFLNNFKSINTVSLRLTSMFKKKIKKKIYYTPNGVDETFFYPISKPKNKKLTLGFVGSKKRDENLGYTKFIKEIMKEEFLTVKCAIYGTDSYLTTDKLNDFYNSLDALIITSRSEGFPLRALEAMSCGTPVISTRVSGCEDLIKEGINGFFIDYDLGKILSKIRYIHQNEGLNEDLRNKTRKNIEDHWSWKKISTSWFNFFKENL
jgi:glycosyltransferase involved in cell wall biosynthesis